MASKARKPNGSDRSRSSNRPTQKPPAKRKASAAAPSAASSAAATRLSKAALPAAGISVAQLDLESVAAPATTHETDGSNIKSGNGQSTVNQAKVEFPMAEDRPPTPHGQAEFMDSTATPTDRTAEPHKVLQTDQPMTLSMTETNAAAKAEMRATSLLEELDHLDTPTHLPPIPPKRPMLEPPLLFEIGWEVCWQLGGIYTVLRTKAAMMLRLWGDRYCLIGPYNPLTAPVEFEPAEPHGHMRQCVQRLQDAGIPCYFGHWMITGRPQVLLLDYRAKFRDLPTDKYLMWSDHHISVPDNDGELNEVIAFGFAVTEFFRILCDVLTDQPVLAHFHEWMAGVAVPRIAHLQLPVSTIFTTHATLLGRYLASDNSDFYNHLPFLDPEAEAHKYLIYPRYQIEKAAAHAAVVFTTVSEVTAYEAEKLLGRRADTILPNGLNIQRFAALHEFQNLHRQYKEKIHEFVMGHFFPAYTFDLENTIYLVTSGRYEYRNKGMDVFIEALYRLNQRLRYLPDRPTLVAFIITKAPVRHVNISALQNQTMFEELKRTCRDLQEEMGQKLFLAAAQGKFSDSSDLLSSDAMVRLKRAVHAWRSGQNPIIVTHDLVNDQADPTLAHLRHRGLFNGADDAVKVVFHPQFVTQTGPLIHLDYEQFVRGCHVGIFPSYYEPWGYTPMECVALGVPAVTTDLSGFGAYVRRHIPESGEKGICVLNRRYRSFDDCCNELVDYLFNLVRMSRRERIELRNKVERLSELFDWSALVRHYREAHDMALERVGAPKPGRVEIRMI